MAKRTSNMGEKTGPEATYHIVVVGGGYAGVTLSLKLLSRKANFTLIDSRDAFHHNVAAVRAIAVQGFAAKSMVPYEATFGSHYKRGKMTGVDPSNNVIHLENDDDVRYDVLVLATGATGPFPCKIGHTDKTSALELYQTYLEKVKSSRRIVAVGGGAVGVEIAGEIATEFPDKEVTLIHRGKHLVMPNLNSSFYKKVDNALGKLHVKVLKEEMVTNLDDVEEGPATLYTDKDSSIEADLIIRCTGLTVNKDGYLAGLGHVVDDRGALRVNKSLQVEGYDNVFAMGDCSATGDAWFAFLAMKHAKIVADNIVKQQKKQSLIKYRGHEAVARIALSVGKNNGIGELKNGMMLPDVVVKLLKSKDLMVGRFWKDMKQKMPK